ncbi:MAG: DUF4956 domain-containing protein [Melioribacteraceae bacterium]|nr:DUF4956 domain-containing protein [Melioribacteraceae bacterium]MCF8353221.1 DUF4956 domain-containing protein [Melioribacteraceae bacterium]MCF8395612.1 DUF4956 domain-containing protein [Melioribacteraceae bacterium]MCF8418745.1 DUF4956 domain-containing protein [Melioribacteraceae bacterium]
MLQNFRNIFQFNITLEEVIANLFVALICGLLLSFFYRKTYRGPGFSISFVNALVILAMITAIVIMVIGNNLARAFGLVGAMSIIRFRTAVKETHDIIFIFFALAVGMASGVGLYAVAIAGTLFIGLVYLMLTKTGIAIPVREEYLLQFTVDASGDFIQTYYTDFLKQYCRKFNLVNTRSINGDDLLELSYYVKLKNRDLGTELVNKLRKHEKISNVNLFFDEEYF